MPQYPNVPESKTEIFYPKSKRRIVLDTTGKLFWIVKIKIINEMTDLKSLIDNSSPLNEIIRTQYKYAHPRAPVHIIATFSIPYDEINDRDLESIAEWSLIQDNDRTILIEDQITLISEFRKMVENWIEEGYENVVSR
jgi:hypothetical protein